MRVRWAGGGRATVDLLRGKQRVARVKGRRGRATVKLRRPGIYILRVRKAGDTRRLAVRRLGNGNGGAAAPRRAGRVRLLRPFERRARCARVRLLTLGAPAFRGRLTIRYRLAARARVRLTIRRGGRVVRVIRRRAARSGRVRVAARRGTHRVALRVGKTRVSVFAIRL